MALRLTNLSSCLLALAGVCIGAETNAAGFSNKSGYHLQRWTTEQGLPQNNVRDITQTPDGYLWVGTLIGLARFDGVSFKAFTRADTPALAHDTINSLAVDSRVTLWIGTPDGLLEWRNGPVKRWTKQDGLPAANRQNIQELFASPEGGLWWRESENIGQLRDGKATTYGSAQGLMTANARYLSRSLRGALLASAEAGFHRMAPGATHFDALVPWPNEPHANHALEDSRGQIWAWGSDGCSVMKLPARPPKQSGSQAQTKKEASGEASLWTSFGPTEGLRGTNVTRMFEDRAGGLWIVTREGGLQRWQDGNWQRFPIGKEWEQGGISSFFEDQEGNIWVGTNGDGLFRIRPNRIKAWTTVEGLPDHEVKSVASGPDGSVWAATRRGLARLRDGRVDTFVEPRKDYPISVVWAAKDGTVWLAKHGIGLFRLDGTNFTEIRNAGLQGTYINAFYEDSAGALWVADDQRVSVLTENRFVQRFGKETFGRSVVAMLEDRSGNWWFGTKGDGLKQLRRGLITTSSTTNGLCDNRLLTLHEDVNGAIWIGSECGLNRWKEGQISAITIKEGLAENVVYQILADDSGHLWFSGLHGIQRVSQAQLNDLADGRTNRVQAVSYGESDGMPSAETNGEMQPAGCKTPDGHLWFPTMRGLAEIDPHLLAETAIAPPVVIEQMRTEKGTVYGDGIGASKSKLSLAPGSGRVIEIHYTANSLSEPERVRFKYKLEPQDREWHESDTRRLAFYTNLRPGDYTFRVIACNQNNLWNETGASLAFSIAPFLYQTLTFRISAVLAIVLTAWGLHLGRIRILRRVDRLEREQALQLERARIAQDLHDDLGSTLTGLALKADLASRQPHHTTMLLRELKSVATTARELVDGMRETIWAVSPRHDTLESLAGFLAQQAEGLLSAAGVRCRLEFPERLPPLTIDPAVRHHIGLAVKEALHNAAKHAGATEVRLKLEVSANELHASVADNGRGFTKPPGEAQSNGLTNMRRRLESIGGHFDLSSSPEGGTTVSFRVPLRGSPKKEQA